MENTFLAFLPIGLIYSLTQSGPIENLKPGEWYEVPNSHLETVKAPASQFPWVAGGEGIAGIMNNWSGGAFDTERDRLYVGPAGGHGGYIGNEVYAFDLNDLKWHRLNDPDPVTSCSIAGNPDLAPDPDVAPFAEHTYANYEYIPPPVDRALFVGSWCNSRTYMFNPNTTKWEVYPDNPAISCSSTGIFAACDPERNSVWIGHTTLAQWNGATHQWDKTLNGTEATAWPGYMNMVYVPNRHLLVSAGVSVANGGHDPCVHIWNISNLTGTINAARITTTGDASIVGSCPGLAYDPVSDKVVAWAGGVNVYTLDVDTKVWTRQPPASTNTVTPTAANTYGTYGRFRHSPRKNVFVVVNHVNENVFIYRLTAGSGTGNQKAALKMSKGFFIGASPNPSAGSMTLSLHGDSNVWPRIRIYDLSGQEVADLSRQFAGVTTVEWNCGNLFNGIYLLKAAIGKGAIVKKLIVQR